VKRPFVVAIGGFDPSCGAGVVADARSIEAMGAMPLGVVTAVTVQSGRGVHASSPLAPALVVRQLDRLLRDLPVAAVKIGQVPSAAIARALARRLRTAKLPVVLDPVLVASGGGTLAGKRAASAIAFSLVPISTLVTVNLDEAGALLGCRVTSVTAMREAAAELEALGARAVLVKGGHLRGAPVDVLRRAGSDLVLRSSRIRKTMHGTGCALASAAAARLAVGDDVEQAVRAAREHVRMLLKTAVGAGKARLRAPSSD
jgi:hydroxymethylpyrimidine/phosphomethylpyrimidine kinase